MANYNSIWTGAEIDEGVGGGRVDPLTAGTVDSGDYVPFYDASAAAVKKAPVGGVGGVPLLDSNGKILAGEMTSHIVQVSASLTLTASHNGCLLECVNSAGITITVPASLPLGMEVEIFREGAGAVQFVAGTNETILCSELVWEISNQYQSACLKQVALDTWALQGAIG